MGMYSLDDQCYEYFTTKEEFDNFMKDRPLVVRCKDCEFCSITSDSKNRKFHYCEHPDLSHWTSEDSYCAWGTRKEKHTRHDG